MLNDPKPAGRRSRHQTGSHQPSPWEVYEKFYEQPPVGIAAINIFNEPRATRWADNLSEASSSSQRPAADGSQASGSAIRNAEMDQWSENFKDFRSRPREF